MFIQEERNWTWHSKLLDTSTGYGLSHFLHSVSLWRIQHWQVDLFSLLASFYNPRVHQFISCSTMASPCRNERWFLSVLKEPTSQRICFLKTTLIIKVINSQSLFYRYKMLSSGGIFNAPIWFLLPCWFLHPCASEEHIDTTCPHICSVHGCVRLRPFTCTRTDSRDLLLPLDPSMSLRYGHSPSTSSWSWTMGLQSPTPSFRLPRMLLKSSSAPLMNMIRWHCRTGPYGIGSSLKVFLKLFHCFMIYSCVPHSNTVSQ